MASIFKSQNSDLILDAVGSTSEIAFRTDGIEVARIRKNGSLKAANATASDEVLTKGQLLTEMKAVDGSGSGLDADTVHGKDGSLMSSEFVIKNITRSNSLSSGLLLDNDGKLWSFADNGGVYHNYIALDSSTTYDGKTIRGTYSGITELVLPKSAGKIVDFITVFYSAYALDDLGQLWVWGTNTKGQLGLGDTTNRYEPILSLTNVKRLPKLCDGGYDWGGSWGGSYGHFMLEKTDGTYWATGSNAWGQLGLGDATDRNVWAQITSPTLPADCDIYINGLHSVFVSGSTVWLCGHNYTGQQGNGTTTNILTLTDLTSNWNPNNLPILDVQLTDVRFDGTTSHGDYTTFMLLSDGVTHEVRSSGINNYYQLGDGTTTTSTTPILSFSPTSPPKQMILEAYLGTVAVLLENGKLYKWGNNPYGIGGIGSASSITTPTLITSGVEQILTPPKRGHQYQWYGNSFIKMTDGRVMSTGYNGGADLGVGDAANKYSYTEIKELYNKNIAQMAAIQTDTAARYFLALTSDGKHLYTWGYNYYNGIYDGRTGSIHRPIETLLTRTRS